MSPRPPRPDAAPYTLVCGDALDVLRGMEAGSVNLFLTDPPYYRVKGAAWDRQWDTPAAFLAWMDALLAEMARVLAPNGSLYLFASPQMAARVEVLVGERFRVLNSIRWEKAEGWHRKTEPAALRSYLSPWEAVIFAEQQGADAFSPLGDAIRTARQAAGLRATDVDVALGYVRTKDPTRGTELCRRWEEGSSIPSAEDFAGALRACGVPADYEAPRAEYEALRRPFDVGPGETYDRWTFAAVRSYPGKHECEKPRDLIAHAIRASSRPGDVVADFFAGSGVVGEMAVTLGRRFVGCEVDPAWHARASERIAHAHAPPLFAVAPEALTRPATADLFTGDGHPSAPPVLSPRPSLEGAAPPRAAAS